MSATVEIFGCSDDLIEIEGDLNEEIMAGQDDSVLLAFGDGTVLDIRYDTFGVWRISRTVVGTADYTHDEDPGDDEDRYSDRVTLAGDLRWVLGAEKPILHKIPSGRAA